MKQYSSRIDNGTLPWPGVLGTVQALANALWLGKGLQLKYPGVKIYPSCAQVPFAATAALFSTSSTQ